MHHFLALHCHDGSPDTLVERAWRQHGLSTSDPLIAVVNFIFEQYWLPECPVLTLYGIYYCSFEGKEERRLVSVTEAGDDLIASLSNLGETVTPDEFADVLVSFELPCFDLKQPAALQTIVIPKPWGQEIWYTGIERRGVAGVTDNKFSIPLPWLLAASPEAFCGGRKQGLILLKILDPLPEPVFGDLYFEVHEEKREVYVVIAVDQQAWPDGTGAIRYGFDADVVASYKSESAFKSAYMESVKQYEVIRREIDALMDRLRKRDNIPLNEPVRLATLKQWLSEVPTALLREELNRRENMERFTSKMPLSVGDVVKVPTHTPHSLQHGVRTIEFQTPVYERLIVSFAQKVVTQQHWDTERAVELMSVHAPEQSSHTEVEKNECVLIERIVDFEDFEALRVTMASGGRYNFPEGDDYTLAIAVSGKLAVTGKSLLPEQALLIPAGATGVSFHNTGPDEVIFLLACPK